MKEVFNHQSSSSEPVGQNLIKLISNVCFSVFVFTVVIFTVIAITYQPPDPWLESAPALTRMFTQSENATFSVDNSMLRTGEDLDTLLPPPPAELPYVPAVAEAEQLPPPPPRPTTDQESVAPPPLVPTVVAPPAIAPAGYSAVSVAITPSMVPVGSPSGAVRSPIVMAPAISPVGAVSPKSGVMIEKKDDKAANMTPKLECKDLNVVNCSDPRVLITVRRFNSRVFKSVVFLEYGIPVSGSRPDECDVAWKFRNRKEKSWRKYRDFRRFRFGIGRNCSFKVVHAGRWHSGLNARSPRSRVNSTSSKAAPPVRDNEINDTIPRIGPPVNFRKGRYLYYSRGGDYCKGMNQYIWSFLCGLGEAMYLNRTFVMDLSMCLPASYNTNNKNEEGKDFRFYFDFEHLKEAASIAERGEFLRDWKKWDRSHKNKVPVRKVMSHKVTPMQLKKEKNTIIWRQFNRPEPENYWYRVCEGPASKYIQRPWRAVWKSKRLMNIVTEINGRMDWDFDAVHVVRGEKAQNKERWPHLDADTSPDALLQKLKGMIQPWRNVYVATNEPFYNYFDKLRSQYKVHLLEDYKELWGNKSEWYNETTLLNNGKPVEFDGYMRVAVDTEVFYRAKTRVETFYNLTKDCKDGINTC